MTFWDWADKHASLITIAVVLTLLIVDVAQGNIATAWRNRNK